MPLYILITIAAFWLVWCLPFVLIKKNRSGAKTLDRRARWGIVLEGVSYFLVFQPKFWSLPISHWRFYLGVVVLLFAPLLSWTGAFALGRQWRVDAGLNPDHELIMAGPYRIIRHPIYASMLCLLLGVGLVLSKWWMLGIAVPLFIVGTEIRVRIEEGLLASQFGEKFQEYKRRTSAYIPFIR